MAPPKAKAAFAMARLQAVQAAVAPFRLSKVQSSSWAALREAESSFTMDLKVDVQHLAPAHLQALALALESRHSEESEGRELWSWLAKTEVRGSLPRLQALLALLGQACGGAGELAPAAGAAYLSLLAAEGAGQQWSLLFQPAIFRQVLCALRVLRRGELRAKKDRREDDLMGEEGEADAAEAEEAASSSQQRKEAVQLLERLTAFLLSSERGLGGCNSPEAGSLVMDELASLMLRPGDEVVARQAAAALSALVAKAGGPEEVRKAAAAALRATLPAVIMTQERLTMLPSSASIPRPLQQARSAALGFVSGLFQALPELLLSREAAPEEPQEEAEEASRKRRRGPKRATADEDEEESDVEMATQNVDEEAVLGAEGADPDEAKRSRRRRPRGRGANDPVVALLELICVLTPDRSEWRSLAADSVIKLLCEAAAVEASQALRRSVAPALPIRYPTAEYDAAFGILGSSEAPNVAERFLSFLERLLESERVACRVLATEVAVYSLEHSGELCRAGQDTRAQLVKKLLLALVRRCSDAVPTVRSRALCGVSTALQFLARIGDKGELLKRIALERRNPQFVDLATLFKAAATDEKPMVRRAALAFFDVVLPILQHSLGLRSKDLASFFEAQQLASLSADESVLVRKSSVASLALLLRSCPDLPSVGDLWVGNVLPLLLDVEASVAERALDELEGAVINPLSELSKDSEEALSSTLRLLDRRLDSEATEYLQRGLRLLAKRSEGRFPPRFVSYLVRTVKDCLVAPRAARPWDWPLVVWSMLEEMTIDAKGNLLKFDLALDAWLLFSRSLEQQLSEYRMGDLGTKILRVLENLVPSAPQGRTAALLDSLCSALASFSAPTSVIRAMMSLTESVEETWKAKKIFVDRAADRAAWRAAFLKTIQAALAEVVRPDLAPCAPIDSRKLGACLFTLGELAIMDASIVSQSIVTQVQTIASNNIWRSGKRIDVDASTRGHAFSALGKLCLRSDSLAKKSVELLVVHLNSNESVVVRNNVLIALGDLCIQYTGLVDRFVPYMTDLLCDQNELLRKQAAMILASLLSEDFIKLRGSIMLRFLYMLSDPADSVRGFVECVFSRILHQRNVLMFSQNFLDVICALNGWAGLANFQGAAGNEDFSLQRSPPRRAMIYRFMLGLMSSDQKFNVCAQIITTLLAAFVDSEDRIELPATAQEPGGQALSDGLSVLCCKEMRICFTTQRAGQDEDDTADGAEKASAEAARGVLSSILKRNVCENIVPVLVQLKNLMEAKHSPFLGQLRHCLREILRDFKDDLKAMLAGDAQLAREIEFDLQEHDGGRQPEGDRLKAVDVILPAQPTKAGGASRRISLSSMMKSPPAALVAPVDLVPLPPPSPRHSVGVSSDIPKALRSSGGSLAKLPVKSSQESSQQMASRGGKRRRVLQEEGSRLKKSMSGGA